MKAIHILLLLGLVASIQINNKHTGLAQLEKRTSVESSSEVQWFLVDDIFIWVYCRIWKCNDKSTNGGSAAAKEDNVRLVVDKKSKSSSDSKGLDNDSNGSNSSNATNSTSGGAATSAAPAAR
jgi:hypothetical protein